MTSPSAYPLSFQIYRLKNEAGERETLTKKHNHPLFRTIGPEARDGTSENLFLVKVRITNVIICVKFWFSFHN